MAIVEGGGGGGLVARKTTAQRKSKKIPNASYYGNEKSSRKWHEHIIESKC